MQAPHDLKIRAAHQLEIAGFSFQGRGLFRLKPGAEASLHLQDS